MEKRSFTEKKLKIISIAFSTKLYQGVQTTGYKAIIINQIVIDVFNRTFFDFWIKINSPPGPLS